MINLKTTNTWTVYMHIIPKELNKYEFDKYYIGITSQNPQKRWGNNGCNYKRNVYFMNAIHKYGWNNIRHEIIAKNLSHKEACDLEKELIKKYLSNDKVHGYNLTDGGEGTSGYKFTKEQYEKLLGRFGDKNSFYGKKHSEETRKLMRLNHVPLNGARNGRAKPIYVFDLDGIYINTYPSTVEASDDLNIKNCIATAASHKTSYRNYLFAREKDIINNNGNIYLKDISEYKIVKKQRNRKDRNNIIRLNKNFNIIKRYKTVLEAHLETGIPSSTIIYQADNRSFSTTRDDIWRWEDDINEITNKTE